MARPSRLSFRLGSIPVRILPSFFITTLLLEYGLVRDEPIKLLVWGAVVLVSVLIHEFGHAATGLAFGLKPQIELHGFGGTTSWTSATGVTAGRRILISLAGPFMGFLAGGALTLFMSVFGPGPGVAIDMLLSVIGLAPPYPTESLANFAYESALVVNVVWGVLNLLPMLPLDGGNVMAQGFDLVSRGRGERAARVVSLVLAASVTAYALGTQRIWSAFLAGSFVAVNWRGLKDLRAREHDEPMRATLEKAYAALEEKDAQRVLTLARPVALESQTAPVRAEALQLMAFGFLLDGRVADADAAIAALPRGFAPHPSLLQLRHQQRSGGGDAAAVT